MVHKKQTSMVHNKEWNRWHKKKANVSLQIPQIRSHVPQFAFQTYVLPCNTHEMLSCIPEYLPCIHHTHEKPNSMGNKSSVGKVPRNHGVVLAQGRS